MRIKDDKQLPEFLQPYFWDVDFDKLAVEKNTHLIIKRILDRGEFQDIRWLLATYGKEKIKKVVLGTRDLSRPTGNFWSDILGLNKTKVPCLQKPYFPIHYGLSS